MSWPPRAEALDGLGQLVGAEDVALAQRAPVGREGCARLLGGDEDRLEDLRDVGLRGVERDARAGQRGGGRRQRRGVDRAPALQGRRQARGRSVRPARRGAAVEDLHRFAERHLGGDEVGAPRGVGVTARGRDEEVQQRGLLAAAGHEQVAARARPGEQRLGHPRREHGRDRRVDGVGRTTVARKRSGVPRSTSRRGSGTSSTRPVTSARSGARRESARTPSSARRSPPSTTASKRPAHGASTRAATSAAASMATLAWPSRRRAKRPELEPPLRWRPWTRRVPTFDSISRSPTKTPAAWPPRRTRSTKTVRSRRTWSSRADGS